MFIEVTKREKPFVPSNEEHSTVMTPYEIPWESLTHSNTWNFTQLALPKPIQNRKPLFIMQDDKGNVTIQFPKREEGQSSRISVQGSRTSSPLKQSFEVNSRKSFVKLDHVDFTPNIPHPRYVTQSHLQPHQHPLKCCPMNLTN